MILKHNLQKFRFDLFLKDAKHVQWTNYQLETL
jgi:hypothetical protein